MSVLSSLAKMPTFLEDWFPHLWNEVHLWNCVFVACRAAAKPTEHRVALARGTGSWEVSNKCCCFYCCDYCHHLFFVVNENKKMYLSLIFQFHVWLILSYHTRYFSCIYSIGSSFGLNMKIKEKQIGHWTFLSVLFWLVLCCIFSLLWAWVKAVLIFSSTFFHIWACFEQLD